MQRLADAITYVNGDGDYIAHVVADSLLAERPISDEPSPSRREVDFLVSSGAVTSEKLDETRTRVSRGALPAGAATALLANLHQTLSSQDAAAFLGLTIEDLGELVEAGGLLAVEVAGQRRFPSWQFSLGSPSKLLPHLGEIVALVADQNWRSIAALMATPQPSMVTEGQHTPIEWFRRGGSVDAFEQLLDLRDHR
jgi:hypothetical protein